MGLIKSQARLLAMTKRLQELDNKNIDIKQASADSLSINGGKAEISPASYEDTTAISSEELDKTKADMNKEAEIIQESLNNSGSQAKGQNLKILS
jgi:hypothetical protein